MTVSSRFQAILEREFSDSLNCNIAVGVSGGPDSTALVHLLSEYCDSDVHALIVDHNLRSESGEEALQVVQSLTGLGNVHAEVLVWDNPSDTRIQEDARHARYQLLSEYMERHALKHLFLGHHMDDQAETFLFRLAKGSGVDGLGCMLARQMMNDVELCRPLLGFSKRELTEFCQARHISYVLDLSNDCEHFARVRLRQSMEILSNEGLSVERLNVVANRMQRARRALDFYANEAYELCVDKYDNNRIVFKFNCLLEQQDEVVFRIVLKAMHLLSDGRLSGGARMHRIEALCDDLRQSDSFRKRTLAGFVFECDVNAEFFMIFREDTA